MKLTGVEKLTASILDEANGEAKAVLGEAEEKIAQMKQKTQQAAERHANEIVGLGQKDAEEQKKRMLAVFGLELRKDQLKVKRQALDEAYQRAYDHLINLPKQEYIAFVKGLMQKSVNTGNEKVLVSPEEKIIDAALVESVNTTLKAEGKTGNLSLGGKAGIKSGFLLEEGGLIVNCSFEMVIGNLRDSTETQVAEILFG
jgi:V/A-type H+-transporting ATPase subunit E